LIHDLTPLEERPPILYKYLGKESARVFLEEPQLRYTKFTELDDICDSIPAFTELTEEESHRQAVERAQRHSDVPVSFEKRIKFFERLGLLPASYLEERLREELARLTASTHICSLSAPNHSLALWSLYADRHAGIAFGISSAFGRVIAQKGRFLERVRYSTKRPNTPFNNPKPADVVSVFWTKGTDWSHQEEWRIISQTNETDILRCGEVLQVIFGYRYTGDKEKYMQSEIFKETRFFEAFPGPSGYRMEMREIRPAKKETE
jgi:hypothetical protein